MQKLFLRVLGLSLAVGAIALSAPIEAATISVKWDAVPGATGYRIHYGTSSGQYTEIVDVGYTTRATIDDLETCDEYFVAVKAYNNSGQSNSYSGEVSGWARPEITEYGPVTVMQGSQIFLDIRGANFEQGVELNLLADTWPVDITGNPLIRIDEVNRINCRLIRAVITVEPTVAGLRAMEIGDFPLTFEVLNPDSVFGDAQGTLQILFDPARADFNQSNTGTTDRVDGEDLVWLAYAHGSEEGSPYYSPDADLSGDGQVDGEDLALLATGFGGCWTGSGWSESACQ